MAQVGGISSESIDKSDNFTNAEKVRLKQSLEDCEKVVKDFEDALEGKPPAPSGGSVGGIAADHLRSFIERIERLEEEKAGIGADIKDVYAEAKSHGFDVKTVRQVIRLRKMEDADRDEQEELLELYKRAIGMG